MIDRGLLYGDGIFETMRAYNGKVFKLNEHLSRLAAAARVMKIKLPYSRTEFEKRVYKILKTRRLKDAYIRITVTREGAVFFIVRKFNGYPPRMYVYGIKVKISGIRQNEYSPLSRIKSLNFLDHILAKERAREEGFDDAILMNTKGYIAEGATANIFLVRRGGLVTPSLDSGILPGITRRAVIRLAVKLGIKVTEKKVLPGELESADEVFLTNSLAEVLPVVKIDRSGIGDGVPGKITKLLHSEYRKMI